MIATRLDVFHAVGEVNVDAPGASQAPAPHKVPLLWPTGFRCW
jgi:hypothetical protein